MNPDPSSTLESYSLLQGALDRYFEGRTARIEPLLRTRLNLKECFDIQKHCIAKDLIKNPINALWAVPYFSVKKVIEISEKLGWLTGVTLFSKIPQALKTDFQKEVERRLATELFGISDNSSLSPDQATGGDTGQTADQSCELTKALESCGLKAKLSPEDWTELMTKAKSEVGAAVSDFCVKQNGFTDLAASGGLLVASQIMFKERSLDIFSLGKKIARRWAHKDAVEHFAFGKKFGHVFYKIAPTPGPTTTQIVFTTALVIVSLALFSTAVTVLSYPLQRRLGFRQKQLEALMDTVNGKLLIELSKTLKKSNRAA